MDIKIRDKRLTEDEVVAQGYLFIRAGIVPITTTLAFTAYEFALNPDCQRRLRDEITGAISATSGEIAYDVLARLPYLDAVVSETLRLYSPTVRLLRVASTDYELGIDGFKYNMI